MTLPTPENPVVLMRGDCLAVLKRLPDASADLVFADPPYFLSNGGTTCRGGKRVSVDKGAWDESQGFVTDHAFQRAWLAETQRALKPSGTLWVSGTQHVIFSIGYAMQELGYHFLNTVTWFKPNAAPNLACRTFTHSTELVIWAAPRRGKALLHTFNYAELRAENGGKQVRDLWEIPAPPPREKTHGAHPTQKPLALLELIIRSSSRPRDLVVDPFCGSGTTGVASVMHGRRFIGIEREAGYMKIAEARIRHALESVPKDSKP